MKLIYSILIISLWLFVPAYTTAASENNNTVETANDHSDDNEPAHLVQSINKYLDEISEQEKSHGAMDPQLGEQLLGLGLLYKNQGQYDKASEVLQRSLQIKRVNTGLQSMAQIPVLEALIDSNDAAGNWDELDTNYHLLLWVTQRNLEPGDPRMLAIYERLGKWELRALAGGLLKESPEHTLSDLSEMYQSTIKLMRTLYGEKDPRLVKPLRMNSLIGYQLARLTLDTPLESFEGTGGTAIQYQLVCRERITPWGIQPVCSNVAVDNPGYYTSKQAERTNTVMKYVYQTGKALRQIAEIQNLNLSASNYDRARSFVDLGDWYFINNRRTAAFNAYKSAYEFLKNTSSAPRDIALLFGKPVRIPIVDLGMGTGKTTAGDNVDEAYVTLSFTVTVRGQARNIKVVDESNPDNIQARINAKKLVSSTLFRPRIVDGDPVDTQNTVLRLSGDEVTNAPGQTLDYFIRNRNYNSLQSRIIE